MINYLAINSVLGAVLLKLDETNNYKLMDVETFLALHDYINDLPQVTDYLYLDLDSDNDNYREILKNRFNKAEILFSNVEVISDPSSLISDYFHTFIFNNKLKELGYSASDFTDYSKGSLKVEVEGDCIELSSLPDNYSIDIDVGQYVSFSLQNIQRHLELREHRELCFKYKDKYFDTDILTTFNSVEEYKAFKTLKEV